MSVVTFDTLKFARKLESAGMDNRQAEAFAEAQKEAFSEALETQLATKADIFDMRSEVKLMRWMIGFNLAFTMAILWKVFS
jgi:hypothetical protein